LIQSSYPVEQLLGAYFQIEPSALAKTGELRHTRYSLNLVERRA
jgi:hypothetical protein